MTPNYLATFRRAVRELERGEKSEISEKSPTLISHNSLISHPGPSGGVADKDAQRTQVNIQSQIPETRTREKSEISEKRGDPPFAKALDQLERCCPDFIEAGRWQQCVIDAQRFLADWGDKAAALGWTGHELFGLHPVPPLPAPTYCRLSRYDATGLIWLLRGRAVVALSESEAAIQSAGAVVIYRKHRKPPFGPLGDSLDDMGVCS
jgi:hypothetical protein